MMRNLFIILAFAILLPASTICGENVSEKTSFTKDTSQPNKKSNSSHSLLPPNKIAKRETPDANLVQFYPIPTAIMSKRSATVLNKLMYALRNSFEKPNPDDIELGSRENVNFSVDGPPGLARENNVDRFPAALVERRGQKDRKIYLRCYFNAVSCFKKK